MVEALFERNLAPRHSAFCCNTTCVVEGDYQDGQTSTFKPVDPNSVCHTVAYGTAPNNLSLRASGTGTYYSVNYYYSGFSVGTLSLLQGRQDL